MSAAAASRPAKKPAPVDQDKLWRVLKKGFCMTPHEFFMRLPRAVAPSVKDCIGVILCQSVGWQQEYAELTNMDFRKATGLGSTAVRDAIQKAREKGLIEYKEITGGRRLRTRYRCILEAFKTMQIPPLQQPEKSESVEQSSAASESVEQSSAASESVEQSSAASSAPAVRPIGKQTVSYGGQALEFPPDLDVVVADAQVATVTKCGSCQVVGPAVMVPKAELTFSPLEKGGSEESKQAVTPPGKCRVSGAKSPVCNTPVSQSTDKAQMVNGGRSAADVGPIEAVLTPFVKVFCSLPSARLLRDIAEALNSTPVYFFEQRVKKREAYIRQHTDDWRIFVTIAREDCAPAWKAQQVKPPDRDRAAEDERRAQAETAEFRRNQQAIADNPDALEEDREFAQRMLREVPS